MRAGVMAEVLSQGKEAPNSADAVLEGLGAHRSLLGTCFVRHAWGPFLWLLEWMKTGHGK